MKKRSSDPVPVVDLPREHELARLAVLVESAMQEPPAGLPQVKWRIRSTVKRHAEWRRRVLRVSLVGALLFLAGGVVGAVLQPVFHPGARSDASLSTDQPTSSAHPRRAHRHLQPPPSADEPREAIPEVAAVSTARPATTEATGATAASTPLAETPSRAMATRTSRPVARLASAASARAPLPPAPPALPSSVLHPAAASATGPVAVPAQPTAELPPQPLQPRLLGGPRPIALVTPPASPAPSLKTPDPPSQMAAPGAAPPAPLPLTTPPLHKPREVATVAPAPADEQVLLGKALQRLRIARDPGGALALLDQHAARFPSGTLAPEAARLRTEALMLTGRKDAVLADLDHQADALAGSDERRLLRGELRATAERWRAALADFDAVMHSLSQGILADVKTREWLERALWGRASVRSHLADQAGARADLLDYLRRFPNGRFAAEARRLVNERR